MQRAKFTVSDFGRCVTLRTPAGREIEYHIPYMSSGDGYVREGSNTGCQVCEGLSNTGNTLRASDETLLDVIRREYRKARKNPDWLLLDETLASMEND